MFFAGKNKINAMKIKNFDGLATSKTRRSVFEIIEAGLVAIDTHDLIKRQVRLINGSLVINKDTFSLKRNISSRFTSNKFIITAKTSPAS